MDKQPKKVTEGKYYLKWFGKSSEEVNAELKRLRKKEAILRKIIRNRVAKGIEDKMPIFYIQEGEDPLLKEAFEIAVTKIPLSKNSAISSTPIRAWNATRRAGIFTPKQIRDRLESGKLIPWVGSKSTAFLREVLEIISQKAPP